MTKKSNEILKSIARKLIAVAVVAVIVAVYLMLSVTDADNKPVYKSKIDTSKYVEATEKLEGTLDDHRLVAKNDSYELYLKDDTLSIKVKDLKTGEVMNSTIAEPQGQVNDKWKGFIQSGVVLTLIKGVDDSIQADLVTAAANETVDVKVTDLVNGFKADVDFTEYRISFTMYVTLEGNDVCVAIPDNTIKEYGKESGKGDIYVVGSIQVYPCLGATYLGEEEGYMFIPDGSGALITLEDKEGKYVDGYSKKIYGEDAGFKDKTTNTLLWEEIDMINKAENILAPVYGMVHTDRGMGYLAIIEEGDTRASIEAEPNGVNIGYNRIYTKFIFNQVYTEYTSQDTKGSYKRYESARTHMDISMRFRFVSGDSADYAGLAVAYREYLLDNGLVKADLDTSYNTRIDFLGTERENWLTSTTAVPMTTIDNIREIYDELKDANITDIVTVYKGWQDGGIQNIPVTEYKADSEIGGTKELTKLVNELKDSDINFNLYQEAVRINPGESSTTFNIIKMNNKRVYEENVYMDVYQEFNFVTPERTATILKAVTEEYTDDGIENIAIAGMSNNLFSYYYSSVYYTRQETADVYEKSIANTSEYMNVMLEQPFAYLWKYTDAFLDMPLTSSNYMYESAQVPFLAIALKGVVPMYSDYVNFEANKKEFFLKLVETGTFPSFYITYEDSAALIYTNSADVYSSKYSVYKQEIINYANELSALSSKVEDAMIIDHKYVQDEVVEVTYDNGVKVYINYTEEAVTVDGVTIDGMSYKVGDGNE